jgi:hypothetical protein
MIQPDASLSGSAGYGPRVAPLTVQAGKEREALSLEGREMEDSARDHDPATCAATLKGAAPEGGADSRSDGDRGEDFAEAMYGVVEAHGPRQLSLGEQAALASRLVQAAVEWVRERNLRIASDPGSES